MPQYMIIMGLYTILLAYILYLVITNMLRSNNKWEQVMAMIVIIPFAMRLFFIK
jgi:cell shape-determining protein MreD